MALLLAVAVTLLAVCIGVLQARNNQLHIAVNIWKEAQDRALSEAREWEGKYWAAYQATDDLSAALDTAEEGEALAPPSHDVPEVDAEAIMAGSDDPVWDLVIDCRGRGIMLMWLDKNPRFKELAAHRRYGEFATYILQLPEDQQTVVGVKRAVENTPIKLLP
jgi:hypothetical protein